MKKGILIVLTVLMLCLCGCMFEDSYHSERAFQGNQELDLNSNVQVVQNYSQLRRLVFNMMNKHEESAELLFSGYTGNVVSDITSVCNALKTESAYGAYCVEYGSYDLTQIVSYYEATIHISYLYTEEELSAMQTTTNLDSFSALLAQELEKGTEKFAVKVNNGSPEPDTVNAVTAQCLRNYPMSLSYEPKINVKIYTGNSSQKVYEVTVEYDEAVENDIRLEEMRTALEQIGAAAAGENAGKAIAAAAEALHAHCVYADGTAALAYDALVSGTANSEGIACAMQAVCRMLGIESMVVSGRADRLEHFWNIVKIEDDYYHVDVSTIDRLGAEGSLFLRDDEKRISHWWDQSAYPYCEGDLRYGDVIAK